MDTAVVPSMAVEFRLWEHTDHDLRCADCGRIITFGQPYAARVDGFIRDVPCCALACVYCAYPGVPHA